MTPGASDPSGSDRLEIRGLRVVAAHGALPEERDRPQPFEVDLDVGVDTRGAARSDDLADTVDYAEVIASALAVVSGDHRQLLESLAEAVAEAVLDLPGVRWVTATVRKLRPPVPYDLASAGVRVTRSR